MASTTGTSPKSALKSAAKAPSIRNVFVAMGSSDGNSEIIREAFHEMGVQLAKSGIRLVYGGGEKGGMGMVAGGYNHSNPGEKALACITEAFVHDQDAGMLDRAETRVEKHLHDRVAFMIEHAEATIIMAGGLGTQHEKATALAVNDMMRFGGPEDAIQPIIIINTNGFYNFQLLQYVKFLEQGQINVEKMRCLFVVATPKEAIDTLMTLQKNPILKAKDLFAGATAPEYWPKSFADHLPKWQKRLAQIESVMADLDLMKPFVQPAPR